MSARGGKAFRPGKFFRPQHDESDDDDDDSDEDEDQPQQQQAQQSSDDDDEDASEEEEEDDDDDEEEEQQTRKSNKRKGGGGGGEKKRPKTSAFFDEEAEASEDDDDDDIPYGTHYDPHDVVKKHYTEEDIQRENMDEEARELMRQQDMRRRQRGGFFGAMDDDDLDAADIAKEIEDRHRMARTRVDRSTFDQREEGAGGPEGVSTVVQQSLVPSVSDPSLWMVSCATGKEQELVFQIMNKCVALARQGKPLGISAAIAAQSKGKIFIESYREPEVKEAIEGVHGLMQYTMRLIPIHDMTTVMTVTPQKKMVKVNEWVRMTRGHYKGDLALIRAVRDGGLKCVVQCVPRLDLALSDLPPEERRIRMRTVRPAQKFFNSQEVKAMGKQTLRRQRFNGMNDIYCDYFEGNYYLDGYLLKEMTVGSMVKPCTDEDPPTLDELQRFRQRKKKVTDDDEDEDEEENAGSKMAASLLDELSDLQGRTTVKKGSGGAGLMIGDTVEVIEGDLVGMQGKLVSLDESTVKVKPNNVDTTDEIEFLASQVRKYIAVGAHVKVTDGRYANETGTVVAVEQLEGESDFTAVILTDTTSKEITVRTSQLRESVERNTGQDRLQGYELYDLVVLSGGGSNNEVGVIVRVGREDFTVVNNHGIVREVRPEELRGKRNSMSSRAVALDVQGNQIRCGDTVNVAEGPHKGKSATIKRMSRSQLFLHSQTRTEHAGIFVVRSRSCVLAGSRSQRSAGGGGGMDSMMSPFSTPQSQAGGRGGPGGKNQKRDDGLIGKTVRIQAGQWKGYLGSVCEATATHVKVELHSRLKKVMVVRERVAVAGDKYGATEDQNRTAPPPTNVMAPTTPFVTAGGATPMHGGATPMHGGATPMHDSMDGDEVWRPGGAIDRDGNDTSNGNANNDDGWGSTNDTSGADDGWGSSSGNAGDGWGSSDANTNNGTSNSQDGNSSSFARDHQNGSAEMDNDGVGGSETAVWFMERVCVQLKSDESQQAVIREVDNNSAQIELLSDKSTRTVRVGDVSMVPPKEHDMVLVTGGADVGVEGELVCIDGSDAILKDSNEDFKIVDFVCLAKIVSDS